MDGGLETSASTFSQEVRVNERSFYYIADEYGNILIEHEFDSEEKAEKYFKKSFAKSIKSKYFIYKYIAKQEPIKQLLF